MESKAFVCMSPVQICYNHRWTGLDPEDGGTIAGGPTSSSMGSKGTYRTFTAGINLTF